jgi:hypothetical protein
MQIDWQMDWLHRLLVAGIFVWVFILAAAIFVGGLFWTIAYSYLVWRADPNRVPPS